MGHIVCYFQTGQALPVPVVQVTTDWAILKQQEEMGAEQKKVILAMKMNGLSRMSQVFISHLPPYLEVAKILSEFASVGRDLVRNKQNNGGQGRELGKSLQTVQCSQG